jgi:hypothetical protein
VPHAAGIVRIHARRAICAMPLHVAARVSCRRSANGFDPARHLPPQAPWLVANFLLDGFRRIRRRAAGLGQRDPGSPAWAGWSPPTS